MLDPLVLYVTNCVVPPLIEVGCAVQPAGAGGVPLRPTLAAAAGSQICTALIARPRPGRFGSVLRTVTVYVRSPGKTDRFAAAMSAVAAACAKAAVAGSRLNIISPATSTERILRLTGFSLGERRNTTPPKMGCPRLGS